MPGAFSAEGRDIPLKSILTAQAKFGWFFRISKMPGAKKTVMREKKITEAVQKPVEHERYIIMRSKELSIGAFSGLHQNRLVTRDAASYNNSI